MSKKDKIKEEIGILKEEYKNFFIVFMTLTTASFTAFYQVVLTAVPLWIAIIGILGIAFAAFVALLLKKKRYEIDDKLNELEELE